MDTIYNFSSIIKTVDGKHYLINAANTLGASYTANSSNTNDIVLGYAAAASFKVSLNNIDGYWDSVILKGAELQLNIVGGLEGVDLGIFEIEEVRKNEGCINIDCIDHMVWFDVKFLGATFPCTVGHLVQVLCDQVNITLATPTFPNSEITIKGGQDFKGVSCRVILTSCMEVAGSFAIINPDGQLEIKWYDVLKIVDTFAYGQMSAFAPEENLVEITGVRFETVEDSFVAGNDGCPLDVPSNNPILKDAEESVITEVLDTIYQKRVKFMSYLPCTFNVASKPALRPGDAIKTTDKQGKQSIALITSLTFTDNIGVKVVSCGKAKTQTKGYTKGYSDAATGDTGDKIGYVLGYNLADYTYTNSTQTICAVAVQGDNDTRVDTQILLTYEFTPTAPETLTITGDVTGEVNGTFEGVIDTTAVSGTQTGNLTGSVTGTAVAMQDAPLVTIDYRMDATTQCRMYQRPHPGLNTFSAAFIPVTQKGGTVSHDVQVTVARGQISVAKRDASLSLLVKNGTVIDTPPWPEINITQTFNRIVVTGGEDTAIKVVEIAENINAGTQTPAGGIFVETMQPIEVAQQSDCYIYVGGDDNLLSPYWNTENLTSYHGMAITSLLDCTLLFNGVYNAGSMGNIMFAPGFEAVDGSRPTAWDSLSMLDAGKTYQMDVEVISGTISVPDGANTDSFNISLAYASTGNPAFLTAKLLQGEITASGVASGVISNLRLYIRQGVTITADNYKIKIKVTEVV
ncbi:hypothetical protein [Eubacterium barkeri]|uniref:Uncharacterized protein n=1 Tax=Eubacterium barkeri TaxID=1528 RepID=A0A1H3HDR1_EUBBA|nr:hypothetical protein [Eubacterium barkeri]SDY12998.1 hypothetical protein SAMN04488579_11736 [Eubacterium barkeri]